MEINTKNRTVINVVYTASSVVVLIINMALLPLYTKNLTSNQFGEYSLVMSVQSFASIFIVLSVFSGMARFFNECEDKNRLKNSVLTFGLICGTAIILIGTAIAPFVSDKLFGAAKNRFLYLPMILANCLFSGIISIYLVYFSMQYKAVKNSIFKIGSLLLTLMSSSYFVIYLKKDIVGILASSLIANAITVAALLISDIKNIRLGMDKRYMKGILRYSLGLIPGNASAWVIALMNRYFINGMISLSAVAVYSIGHKFGMLIHSLLIEPHSSFFTPYKFEVCINGEGRDKIRSQYEYFNTMSWLIILGLSLFSNPAISVLTTSAYREAFKVVPIIAFSYYLSGLSDFYCIGLHLKNKMLLNSLITAVGAVANIALNVLLIPRLGMYGAALSTAFSFLVALILYYITAKKYYDFGIGLLWPWKNLIAFGLIYLAYYISREYVTGVLPELLLGVLLFSVYIMLGICFKLIPLSLVKKLLSPVKELLSPVKELLSRVKNRFVTNVYAYRLNLKDPGCKHLLQSLVNPKFTVCELDTEILKRMHVSNPAEITVSKNNLIKERILPGSNMKGYVAINRNNDICGFAHISFCEIYDSCVNLDIINDQAGIHIFDAYTFCRFRGTGVCTAIYRELLLSGMEMGLNTATINVIEGNVPAESVCRKLGFIRFRKYKYYHFFFIKLTIVKEAKKWEWKSANGSTMQLHRFC
ncbi:MAG: polysaccharide biosynthesis C-terminal domain-containing protein [Eubacteriales bacterium]|nr:polysaccharide biosynthesis C-terminal domain-containing protein [Eubacteriales bacterium]